MRAKIRLGLTLTPLSSLILSTLEKVLSLALDRVANLDQSKGGGCILALTNINSYFQ